MLNTKGMRFPVDVILVCLAGIELIHMICKGQFMLKTEGMSFADQFYALAGQLRPV